MFPMSRKKKRKKCKDFPNEWAFYKKLKPKQFQTCTFSELMEGLVNRWHLAPGVVLVARTEHLPTGSIEEYAFASTKQVKKLMAWVSRTGEPYKVYCYDHEQSFTAIFNDD